MQLDASLADSRSATQSSPRQEDTGRRIAHAGFREQVRARHEPDRLDARLPLRWPQGEIGKIPAFIIPVTSD